MHIRLGRKNLVDTAVLGDICGGCVACVAARVCACVWVFLGSR